MCGIAGIIRFDGEAVDRDRLCATLTRLAHRGKDDSGIAFGSAHSIPGRTMSTRAEIALGHRRLSIIDLSPAAAQPMSFQDGRLWITFNGEIFNYIELREELRKNGLQFNTDSDTEVVLAAYRQWGEACVERLNGMFAFALWDDARRMLFCARDHLGVKPFYFCRTQGYFAFASESRALYEFHRNTLDQDGIGAYLLSLYVPASWSVFSGVSKLLPAHAMSVDSEGRTREWRYWSITACGDLNDSLKLRRTLEEKLDNAIARQLRSDVPVGALLSGGVDSGMIVALAAQKQADIHTYSVGFEGQQVNELPAAAQVAATYRTRHHATTITDKDAIRLLDKSIACLTEPIADPAIIPTYVLSEMAASDGVKVLLSGAGGDEIFGGYSRYAAETTGRKLLRNTPRTLQSMLAALLPASTKLGARLRDPYLDMLIGTAGSFELCSAMQERRTGTLVHRLAQAFPATFDEKVPGGYRQMGFDMNVYLPDELLFLLDQMTMAHTIEGRVPLIDVDVVETAFRFPFSAHVKAQRTKVLFREVATPYLGEEHVWRRKQGFAGPVPWWVNRNLPHFVAAARAVVDIPGMPRHDLLARCGIDARRGDLSDRDCHAVFILYCLSRWYQSLEST